MTASMRAPVKAAASQWLGVSEQAHAPGRGHILLENVLPAARRERLETRTIIEWRRLHEGGLDDIRAWHADFKNKGRKPTDEQRLQEQGGVHRHSR